LMQFQSDILDFPVMVPAQEELSGIGVSYMAGIALKIYDKKEIFALTKHTHYSPSMNEKTRKSKKDGWKAALSMIT